MLDGVWAKIVWWGQSSLHPIKHHPPPTTRSGTALTSKLSVGPVKGRYMQGPPEGVVMEEASNPIPEQFC